MVVEDLEEETDRGYKRCAVAVWLSTVASKVASQMTYTCTALSACMSLIASLKRPPVLLPTISR